MKLPSFLKLKFTRRRIIILAVLLILILGGLFLFNQRGRPQLPQFAPVQRQDLKSTISASGTLAGKNTASLKFKGSGKLAFLSVKPGDSVQAGQTIAGLDTQDLSISLQQARNTLKDKQAGVDKVLDDIHLFQYGNGGFANVGTANETQAQRQARMDAETARDSALDSVKAAERSFQDAALISPISGIVIKADPVPGQNVSPSDVIAQITDNTKMVFEADVDEADVGKVFTTMPVDLTLDAYPIQTFHGTVEQILPATKTTSNGATVVTTKITVQSAGIHFVSGLNGQASIITVQASNVLAIPQDSLREDNTVLVQTPQGPIPRKVTPGLRSDTDVEIKSGLKEGERVVKNPPAPGQQPPSNPLLRLFRGFSGPRGGR